MLIPVIQADEVNVSIGKLSNFIDFFNYYPLMVSSIKHKNTTSDDLKAFIQGKTQPS